jgi:hypothetical protein
VLGAFGIVHPGDALCVLRLIWDSLYPIVQISSYASHRYIKLDSLVRRTGKDIFVNPEDGPMNPRPDSLQPGDMNERFNVGPLLSKGGIERTVVRQIPELGTKAWQL